MSDVTINKTDIERIVDYLLNQAERPIAEMVSESDEFLKDAANKFLIVLEYEEKKLEQLKQNINKLQQIKRQINKTYTTKVDREGARSRNEKYQEYNNKVTELKKQTEIQQSIRNIYSAGLAFQDIVNKALGQDPIVVVTASASGNTVSYKVPLRSVLDPNNTVIEIGSKGGISLRFRTSLKQMEEQAMDSLNAISKIETKIQDVNELAALNRTYHTVLERFHNYKGKNDKGKEVGIILWNKEGWKKSFPSSAGDITEAYNSYFLTGKTGFGAMTGNLDDDIDIFMNMVTNVDNAAGRLIGDISVQNEDDYRIEYAIKAVNASLQSYKQIKQLADIVLGKSNRVKRRTLGKGDIRSRLTRLKEIDEETKAFRNKIFNLAENDVIKCTKEIVDEELAVLNNIAKG